MNGYCTCQKELAKLSCTSTLFFVSSYSVISYHNCYKIPYFLIHRIIWMTLFSPPHILVTFFVTQASKFFKFFILIALNDFIFTFADRMASALHNILSVSYIWEGYRVWLTYLLVYLIYSWFFVFNRCVRVTDFDFHNLCSSSSICYSTFNNNDD